MADADRSHLGRAHLEMAVWLLNWAVSPFRSDHRVDQASAATVVDTAGFVANDYHLAARMASNVAPGWTIIYLESDGAFYSQPFMPLMSIPVQRIQRRE